MARLNNMTQAQHAAFWAAQDRIKEPTRKAILRAKFKWLHGMEYAKRNAPRCNATSKRDAKHDSAWQADAKMRVAGRGYLYA